MVQMQEERKNEDKHTFQLAHSTHIAQQVLELIKYQRKKHVT